MKRLPLALLLSGALIALSSRNQPAVSVGVLDSRGLDSSCTPVLSPGLVSCRGEIIAVEFPMAGVPDNPLPTDLTATFDSLSDSTGLTATYDPIGTMLPPDQPLKDFEASLIRNADPGLDVVPVARGIPAPVSIVLFGIGVVGLATARQLIGNP